MDFQVDYETLERTLEKEAEFLDSIETELYQLSSIEEKKRLVPIIEERKKRQLERFKKIISAADHERAKCPKDGITEWYFLQLIGYDAKKKKIRSLENELKIKKEVSKILDEDIKRARETPILNFVKEHKNYMIRCPVHNDKNPSCHVTKNLWHCFSCGAGGDTIRFIEKTQNLKFIDAVKYIINQ